MRPDGQYNPQRRCQNALPEQRTITPLCVAGNVGRCLLPSRGWDKLEATGGAVMGAGPGPCSPWRDQQGQSERLGKRGLTLRVFWWSGSGSVQFQRAWLRKLSENYKKANSGPQESRVTTRVSTQGLLTRMVAVWGGWSGAEVSEHSCEVIRETKNLGSSPW